MPRMDSMLNHYLSKAYPKIKLLTPEEEAEIAAEEAAREADRRWKLSGVPYRFKDAKLSDAPSEVQAYADSIRGKKHGPWLILVGENGTRKTTAACAVANDQNDMSVKFVTMGKILGEVYDTFGSRETSESVMYRYTKCRLLIIDDFGKEKPSIDSASRFFRIINERHENRKPTIFTTNLVGADLLNALTVGVDSYSAKAIIDRMSDKENTFVRMDGRSMRR